MHKPAHFHWEMNFLIIEEKKEIHILDLNQPNTTSVTNAITFIQEEFAKQGYPHEDYTWVLYGTDGIPALYKRGEGFRYPHGIELIPEFEEYMKEQVM
jgi:hypothetical protein